MGFVEREERTRVHIDTDVATGLAFDEVARATVAEYRRNGCQLLVSPTVVGEIARTFKPKRDRILRAVVDHCTGMTNEQAPDILRMEIEGLVTGKMLRPGPVLPITELNRLFNERFLITGLGDPTSRDTVDAVGLLQGVVSELKGEKLPAFEEYLMANAGRFGKVALKIGARYGLIPERQALRNAPGGRWAKAEMTGLAAKIALTAANVWRRKHNLGKGKGTLSDMRQVIEAAHAAVFLTRDKDLVATYELVRGAVTDFRPIITLVPRP